MMGLCDDHLDFRINQIQCVNLTLNADSTCQDEDDGQRHGFGSLCQASVMKGSTCRPINSPWALKCVLQT